MNEDILKRLNDLYANCIDIRGRNGQKIDIQLQKIIDDILEKEKTNKYHFYSATYPTHSEIVFVICVAGWDEGESEKIVYPLLGESWQIISEDTYSKNKEFSRENFQSAIVELNKLGFQYKGPIDDEAIS